MSRDQVDGSTLPVLPHDDLHHLSTLIAELDRVLLNHETLA